MLLYRRLFTSCTRAVHITYCTNVALSQAVDFLHKNCSHYILYKCCSIAGCSLPAQELFTLHTVQMLLYHRLLTSCTRAVHITYCTNVALSQAVDFLHKSCSHYILYKCCSIAGCCLPAQELFTLHTVQMLLHRRLLTSCTRAVHITYCTNVAPSQAVDFLHKSCSHYILYKCCSIAGC